LLSKNPANANPAVISLTGKPQFERVRRILRWSPKSFLSLLVNPPERVGTRHGSASEPGCAGALAEPMVVYGKKSAQAGRQAGRQGRVEDAKIIKGEGGVEDIFIQSPAGD
jgi:hypothetical protein